MTDWENNRKIELGQSTQDSEMLLKHRKLVVLRPLGMINGLGVQEGTIVL